MAYDNPGGGGEESMYSDAPETKAAPAAEEGGEDKGGGKTYLLPKEVLEGKKFEPGDEVVLRIVAMHDDQIEVAYAPAKEQEGGKGGEEGGGYEAPPEGGAGGMGDREMSSMME